MAKVDVNKCYHTRGGRLVCLYHVYDKGDRPVHGAIYHQGQWQSASWLADGAAYLDAMDDDDLVPVEKTVHVNILHYPEAVTMQEMFDFKVFTTSEDAIAYSEKYRNNDPKRVNYKAIAVPITLSQSPVDTKE